MIAELEQRIQSDWQRPPDMSIFEWAEANCDFSKAPSYETPLVGPYKTEITPYVRKILDWCQDSQVREIVVRKCSRAGISEAILMWLRWIVSVRPMPTYYLTADQLLAERFMVSRIKRGWSVCPQAAREYRQAHVTEHDIRFPKMDFRISWPNARGAFKQDGWAAIVADEFSTWKAFAPDMLRKRAGTYRFHTIVMLSSPDPSRKGADQDPIVAEFDSTDKNLWMMKDPETGNLFHWQFGGADSTHGLKWPADAKDPETGEWDLERVRNEAYFITPDGTRIDNKNRVAISSQGEWVPTADGAPAHVRGCWIVGPMVPFLDGDFGVLAYRFLEAKRKGSDALRAYFFENWADVGMVDNSLTAADNALRSRQLQYPRGEPFFSIPEIIIPDKSVKGLIMTIDVQKYHLWWLARWWVHTGESCQTGLEDWGTVANFDDLVKLEESAKPNVVGIDIGYAGRYGETADYCSDYNVLAMKGEDNMKGDLNLRDDIDPTEGRKSRSSDGRKFSMLTWNTDVFRSKLLSAVRGETPFVWNVYRMPERDYVRQVMSTHKVDGEWVTKKGHPNDHLFDCEAMQLVLARFDGLIQ